VSITERPTDQAAGLKRIVVGVDGSPASIRALQWASRVGGALGIELLAITAWEYPATYGASGVGMGDWRPDVDAEQALADAVATAFGEKQPPGLQSEVRKGYPAKVMLDAGDGAEMLVLGSRGHGGFVGLLLGSVSAHCAELATCPVVVVHDISDEQR
jgi:nucleotide-binding universal stress UspA family protein